MSQSFYTFAVWGNGLLAAYPEIERRIALRKGYFKLCGKIMRCYIIDTPDDLNEFIGIAVENNSIIRCYKEVFSRETDCD